MLLMLGCGSQTAAEINEPSTKSDVETVIAKATQTDKTTSSSRLGFEALGLIINDDGEMSSYMTMYGFLRSTEYLGIPTRVYRAKNGANTTATVEIAYSDGMSGVCIVNKNSVNDEAVKRAAELGMKVVVPYDLCSVEDENIVNVVADDADYYDELARGIAERMTERSLKSGRILVYGRDTKKTAQDFQNSINASYPQFIVVGFDRVEIAYDAAINELAQFVVENRDIKGMYVVDTDAAEIAVKAREKAQAIFKSQAATPTPKPTPTPSPTATPSDPQQTPTYIPNPALLKNISITLFCCGISDKNFALFDDNDIYALCIEPYYEAAAQAAILLTKMVGGDEVPRLTKVNRPIVYGDTIEKYMAIYDQVNSIFGLR